MDIDMAMNAEGDWKMLADDLLTLVPREAVCILSTDLRIVHVNTAWSHIFGHAPEEAIGSPWTSRCCGQTSGLGEINNLNTAIATCQHALEPLLCYRKDATQFRAVLAVVPVGLVAGAGQPGDPGPGVLVALLVRDLPPAASEVACIVAQEQLQLSAYLTQQALQAMLGPESPPPPLPPPPPPPAAGGGLLGMRAEEAPGDVLVLLLERDDYPRLRGLLLAWGAAGAMRVAGLAPLACPVCPAGFDFAAAVQGNLAAAWHGEGGGGFRAQGMGLGGLDPLQYALAHAAFRVAALLIIAGWAGGSSSGRCVLSTAAGREVGLTTADLCGLYSRSYAATNPMLSNMYAQAGFVLRRWPEVASALGIDPANGLASVELAGEDGDACLQAVTAAVQDRVAGLHRAFLDAAAKPSCPP